MKLWAPRRDAKTKEMNEFSYRLFLYTSHN